MGTKKVNLIVAVLIVLAVGIESAVLKYAPLDDIEKLPVVGNPDWSDKDNFYRKPDEDDNGVLEFRVKLLNAKEIELDGRADELEVAEKDLAKEGEFLKNKRRQWVGEAEMIEDATLTTESTELLKDGEEELINKTELLEAAEKKLADDDQLLTAAEEELADWTKVLKTAEEELVDEAEALDAAKAALTEGVEADGDIELDEEELETVTKALGTEKEELVDEESILKDTEEILQEKISLLEAAEKELEEKLQAFEVAKEDLANRMKLSKTDDEELLAEAQTLQEVERELAEEAEALDSAADDLAKQEKLLVAAEKQWSGKSAAFEAAKQFLLNVKFQMNNGLPRNQQFPKSLWGTVRDYVSGKN